MKEREPVEDLSEIDLTEDEIDEMMAQGEPVDVVDEGPETSAVSVAERTHVVITGITIKDEPTLTYPGIRTGV